MKKVLVLCLFILPYIAFSQKGKDIVMPMGNGMYTVSRQGNGFASLGKLKKQAYEIANKFAEKNNSTAEVISVNETPMSFGIEANVDLKFRLVSKSKVVSDDSKQTTISISSGQSANGKTTDEQLIINNPKQDSKDKFEKLERIGKLYKDGTLTKEEFEAEKKKILSEN